MANDIINKQNLAHFADKSKRIFAELRKDVIGQNDVVEFTVLSIIAGGNVLLEGAPGLGKTRLVRSLGKVFDLPFSRIQFTPDLMPADVTGTSIIVKDNRGNSSFSFQPGPIFSNIVLADEINRATPKTQSALLEAMQEHTVTVMGESRKLSEPFFVLATQNPIEQDGTYPLPEAQMDRFMFKLIVPFPSVDELEKIVNVTQKTMDETAQAVCSGEELLQMRATAKGIPVADEVMYYAMLLIAATYPDNKLGLAVAPKYLRYGASPRAAQAIITAAKVRALLHGRYNVSFDDINALAVPALRHRIKLSFEAVTSKMTADTVVKKIIAELKVKLPALLRARAANRNRAPQASITNVEPAAPAMPVAPQNAYAAQVPYGMQPQAAPNYGMYQQPQVGAEALYAQQAEPASAETSFAGNGPEAVETEAPVRDEPKASGEESNKVRKPKPAGNRPSSDKDKHHKPKSGTAKPKTHSGKPMTGAKSAAGAPKKHKANPASDKPKMHKTKPASAKPKA